MVFLLMGGAYLRSRIKQAGKWDQETIVSFFLCQYCSGEYLRLVDAAVLKEYIEIKKTINVADYQPGNEVSYLNSASTEGCN